jgi:hypothetical protein
MGCCIHPAFLIPNHPPVNPFCTSCLKKTATRHTIYIPWFPFLTLTQWFLPHIPTTRLLLGSLPSTACFFTRTHSLPVPYDWLWLVSGTTYTPNNLIPVIPPAYTAYEDGTECSETSAYKIQTPGNHPKERIQKIYIYSQGGKPSVETIIQNSQAALTYFDQMCYFFLLWATVYEQSVRYTFIAHK